MRTVVLIVATLVLIAGAFALYLFSQSGEVAHDPGTSGGGAAQTGAAPMQDDDSTYTVRGGKQVWLKEFDENRRLVNQFRADEFNPQKEGFVRVKRPEAHFFLKGGQWIRVTGETGDVVVSGLPESGGDADPFGGAGAGGPGSIGGGAAPSRGRLQNVRIQYYESNDPAAPPMLDMDMNNAAFDNESFRIYTEGYTDADGKQIAADQVKVTVRGKYEFDGRGLTIRWNDRDRRLELLEIAHGERLVIKEPGNLGTKMPGADGKRAEAPSPTSAGSVASATLNPLPIALVSSDKSAAVAAARAQTAPTTSNSSTLYSIWFYDNVQVVQADQTLAMGNAIEVFYSMRDTPEKAGGATTAPAAAPAPSPAPDRSAKPQAASTAPSEPETSSATPATAPASEPQKQPQQPVIIYWTGKLRVVPSATPAPVPLDPGESAIEMRGLPVVLTRENVQIRCPSFTYRTADGGVTLNRSEAFPQVEIAQFANIERSGKPDVTLFSERIEYMPEQGVATLGGKSRAVFPADADEGGTPATSGESAQATWTREGVARFTGSGSETVIRSLDLGGDVDVQHPQVSLKSQRLRLEFDPPAPASAGAAVPVAAASPTTKPASRQPVVRQVLADDSVHCVLLDEDGQERQLHGDHLQIDTATDPATGRLYPRMVKSRGNVRAMQEGQELASEELDIVLAPAAAKSTAKPAKTAKADAGGKKARSSTAVELQRMEARRNVRAVSKDGDVATGSSLVAAMSDDGKLPVGLSGKPAKLASANGTVLTSERIVIPDVGVADEAQAVGPGTLHVATDDAAAADKKQPAAAGAAPPKAAPRKNMDVSWTKSALVNMKLKEHHVQVVGDVKATMRDPDGTVSTASGERILITLSDPPAAAPATQPAGGKKKPQAVAGALGGANVDVMKGRQVNRILVNKDAVVNSKLAAADGSVLREMQIDSSLLDYRVGSRRLLVQRPGRMLVRDHRPPGAKDAKADEEDGLGSQRGATAFQWSEQLDYNGAEQRATMNGDVLVAYKPDAAGEPPVQLRADEVVATFEEKQDAAAAAPDKADPAGMNMPAVQLRSVRAEGNVSVLRGGEELTAPRLVYDPVGHWIRAIGTEQTPAVFAASNTGNTTSGREFHWNTKTWQIRVIGAAGRVTVPPR